MVPPYITPRNSTFYSPIHWTCWTRTEYTQAFVLGNKMLEDPGALTFLEGLLRKHYGGWTLLMGAPRFCHLSEGGHLDFTYLLRGGEGGPNFAKYLLSKIARWVYEYNRHGFWVKAISVPPPSINNNASLMQWKRKWQISWSGHP